MAKEVEAILRLQAKLGAMGAFDKMSRRLSEIERKSIAFNTVQAHGARMLSANVAAFARIAAPSALGYAAKQAFVEYAKVERSLTRVGLVIGATREQMSQLRDEVSRTAQRYALSSDAVMETVAAYSAAGAGLADIKQDIDLLAKAQQALDTAGGDIVNTWDSARKSFGLMSSDAQKFFELIGAGSAAGKFEASSMARELPSILPRAKRQGMSGLEGTADLVAGLEAMADRTGTPGEAATALSDFLEKSSSPDVERAFKKMGVDLPKGLKEARAAGKDFYETMRDFINLATKHDPSKLGYLYGDKEARSFADLLVNGYDRILDAQNKVRANAPGLLDRNNAALMADSEAALDRMIDKAKQLALTFGGGLAGIVNPALDWANDTDNFLAAEERGAKAKGMSGKDLFWYRMMTSKSDRAKFAHENGYRSDQDRMVLKGYGDYQAARLAGTAGDDPDLRPLRKDEKAKRQRLPQTMTVPGMQSLPQSISLPGARPELGDAELTDIQYPTSPTFGPNAAGKTSAQRYYEGQIADRDRMIRVLRENLGHVGDSVTGTAGTIVDTAGNNASSWWGGHRRGKRGRLPRLGDGGAGGRLVQEPDQARFGPIDAGPIIEGADALRKAMETGGEHSADQMRQAAQGMLDAGNAIMRAAGVIDGAGTSFGRDAASAFRSGIAGATVGMRVPGGNPANPGDRDLGRTMPNAGRPIQGGRNAD